MNEAAVRCTGLSKHFGGVPAVAGVDLSLPRGGFLALLGASGCGKTTLLRLIAGFEQPDAGSIAVGGRLVFGPGVNLPPERRRVGMVFQDYALFPHLTVAENVAFGLPRGAGREARVREMLTLVGLAGLERRLPHALSGGQQQRVALARALAPEPDLILLDEPFSSLDAALRTRVRAEVRQILVAAGATAIFVTHDQEEALSLADEVAVMAEGRIIQRATPEELYHQPASLAVAAFIGDANILAGEAHGGVVTYALGRFAAGGAGSGPVVVLLRPEGIRLHPDPAGPAQVVQREFFGHDQLVMVELAAGGPLRARLGPEQRLRPGDRVRVEVQGRPVVLAGAGAPPQPLAQRRRAPGR